MLDYDTLKKNLRIVHGMTIAGYTVIRRGSKQAHIFSIQKPEGIEIDVENTNKKYLQMESETEKKTITTESAQASFTYSAPSLQTIETKYVKLKMNGKRFNY